MNQHSILGLELQAKAVHFHTFGTFRLCSNNRVSSRISLGSERF